MFSPQAFQRDGGAPRGRPVAGWAGIALACLLAACGKPEPATLTASAQQRLARDDYAGALIEARSALQQAPDSAAARLTLAKAMLGTGQTEAATAELHRALDLGASAQEVALIQASITLGKGDAKSVIALARAGKAGSAQGQADLLVLAARAHAQQRNTKAAETALREALSLVPEHAAARLQLARLAGGKQRWAEAAEQVDAVLARRADDADAWMLKGELALQRTGDDKAAEALFRKAVQLRPGHQATHARLILLYLARKDQPAAERQAQDMARSVQADSRTDYMQALVAHAAGDLAKARDLAQRSLRAGGAYPPALFLAGVVERRAGAPAQAEALLVQAMGLLPDAPEPRRELASLYAGLGQGQQALDILKPLLKPTSTDIGVWQAAGQAYTVLGDFRRADEAFARAAKLDPKDAATRLQSAQSLLARGAMDPGIAQLEAAARLSKDAVAEQTLLAMHMRRKDHAAALRTLEALERKQAGSAVSELVRGQIHAAAGKADAARTAFEAALVKDPRLLPAVHGLAQLDAQAGDLGSVRKRYQAVIERDSRATSAMLELARLTRQAGGSSAEASAWIDRAVRVDPRSVDTWRQAIEHHRRTDDALAVLARAREANAALPDDAALLAELGQALTAAREHQQAVAVYERAVKAAPDSAAAQLRLAQALVDARRPERAGHHIARALALAPNWAPALRSQLTLLQQDPNRGKAQAFVRQTQARLPRQAIGWQLEAEMALQQQNWKQAVAALRTAAQKADGAPAALQLHRILIGAGKPEEAERFAQGWIKAHAGDVDFRDELGHAALGRADWAAAEAHFRAALAARPDSPLLQNNLAYVLVKRKDEGALALAQQAVRGAPDLAPAVDTLALAYAEKAQFDKAIEWQSRAVDLAPKVGLFRLHLARYHLRAGDKDKARAQLQRLQDQGSGFPAQDEVRRLLQQAQG